MADGTLPQGSQLPPEDSLIARFKVSRTTVRQAIQNLANRGLVEIRRGRGTFVAKSKITQEITHLTGFVEDMQAQGRHPTARVLQKEIVTATKGVAKHLDLAEGARVVRIRRVRLADGIPISLDETYLPHAIGKKILSNDLEREPIFALLEQKYGTPLIEAKYTLEAVVAEASIAKALAIEPKSAIFLIERTVYSSEHRPVDYEKLYYRGDQIRFTTRLARATREG
ncbi:GntR family transcriptional regulator [Pendulispora brunnea]|uniref:GntR family transcriptional regulator n=2 Tax=Pendulispora brunnea TaxID=2905690 RepID=A0ABZ2K1L3_9BACT